MFGKVFKSVRRKESTSQGDGRRSSKYGGKSATEAQGRYPDPPDHGSTALDLEKALQSFSGLVSAAMKPLPTGTGDGTYLEEDDDQAKYSSLWKDLTSIGIKDVKTLADKIRVGSGPVDDRTMLMERVIQLVAELPTHSKTRFDLTNQFVNTLFTSLQHPPVSYLGDKFKYRQADGSYNNIMYPHLGAANTPYARSVQPLTVLPASLPDPGIIFDSVLAREEFRPHPNKNSSVIFYWASIIIHDLFQTDHEDVSNSQTSSYLDLSPLYGDTQEDQNTMRTFKDGLLKPDCFAEYRLLTFPPGCGCILIMFNRFHNYVAKQLALINENNRFPRPKDDADSSAWAKYDNDLFQTARLVTCGLYMNITLIDYVRTIVNLTRSNTTWTLDPRVKEYNTVFDDHGTPRGVGNQVSVEFNLVYRWHPAISERDDKWTQVLFKEMFGKEASEVTMEELIAGLVKWEQEMPEDPHARNFNNMKRDGEGKFSDDELAEILATSIEDVAGSFGPNHIPKALRAISILGMQQARSWECGTLNEFRQFFGLKEHTSFDDITKDPEVANQLRILYEHPQYVELYTGLFSEDAKLPIPEDEGGPVGVGICPGYTISRAILSDAVALVRGDRFYTVDYTPRNLTNWGYTEVAYDFNVEQGCSFSKLFLRALPNHFKPNSIYAHMPMTIPEENRKIMRDLNRESNYSWDRPTRQPERILIQNYNAVKQVMEDQDKFKVMWSDGIKYCMGEGGAKFMLSGDGRFYADQRKKMSDSLYRKRWNKHVWEFYCDITTKLLKENSEKIKTGKDKYLNQVDITRDVGNLAHVHFAASVFSLPLKSEEHPRGVYTEHQLYLVIALAFTFIFFDVDPVKTFPLALAAYTTTQQLGDLIEKNVEWLHGTGFVSNLTDKWTEEKGAMADYGVHMVRRLIDTGMSTEDITWSQILPTAVAMVPNQAQIFTQVLDFLINEGHWPDVVRLARKDTAESEETILHYIMEAMRLNGTFGTYREVDAQTTLDDKGYAGQVNVKAGDRVFVSFVEASRDPEIFQDPEEVKLNRPLDSYLNYGKGPHECLGKNISQVALTAMVKTVAKKCNNLRPAPGAPGKLKKVPRENGFYSYMTEDQGKYFPFPTTWKLHYDGEIED